MVRLLPRDTKGGLWTTAGTWRPARSGKGALVGCPNCTKEASLGDHQIAGDGTVTPSLVCPHSPCSFHEFVKLEDWRTDG